MSTSLSIRTRRDGGEDDALPGAGLCRPRLFDVGERNRLVQTSFVTMAVLSKVGAEHDLSLTQLRVLAILRDRRVKMSELADYLGLDKSTISGLVDRAEKRRLLRRTPNPIDGRAVDVCLSKQGMELADRGATQIAEALSPMTSTLSRADTQRLTTLLMQMLDPDFSASTWRGHRPAGLI